MTARGAFLAIALGLLSASRMLPPAGRRIARAVKAIFTVAGQHLHIEKRGEHGLIAKFPGLLAARHRGSAPAQ